MWLKSVSYSQLFVAFLLFYYNGMMTSATNMAQLNNQQQALGQATVTTTTSAQQHQHPHHFTAKKQHQLQQQQPQQTGGIAAHPDNGISSSANSVLYGSKTGHLETETQSLPSALPSLSTSTLAHLPPAQYVVHEKEAAMQDMLKLFQIDNDLSDPYQILNELKKETQDNLNHGLPSMNSMTYPWKLHDKNYAPFTLLPPQMAALVSSNLKPFETLPAPFPVTPRFLPLMSYPQPVYVPYPLIMTPEMFYASYSSLSHLANDYDDSMSRGAGSSRRPASSQGSSSYSRNSPIYYVRLPPTPYMFLPSLNTPTMPAYQNVLPYRSLPTFPSLSSLLNVPINFLANGKPTNIYQMSAPPNDLQNPMQFFNIPSSFNTRPPPPPPPNAYRPAVSSHNYFNSLPSSPSPSSPSSNYASASHSSTPIHTSSSSSLSQQDSKLIALKHPFFFNGRPEDIYILPNNFNPLYSSESSYY